MGRSLVLITRRHWQKSEGRHLKLKDEQEERKVRAGHVQRLLQSGPVRTMKPPMQGVAGDEQAVSQGKVLVLELRSVGFTL